MQIHKVSAALVCQMQHVMRFKSMKCLHISAELHTCCSASITLIQPCVKNQQARQEQLQHNRAHHTWMKPKQLLQCSPGNTSDQTQVPAAATVSHSGGINSRVSVRCEKCIFSQPGAGNKCQWASASRENVKSSSMSCTYLALFSELYCGVYLL